jgi:hypothetical protein
MVEGSFSLRSDVDDGETSSEAVSACREWKVVCGCCQLTRLRVQVMALIGWSCLRCNAMPNRHKSLNGAATKECVKG